MIDFVKLNISSDIERVKHNEGLTFYRRIAEVTGETTGEFKDYLTADYVNIKLILKKNRFLGLEGSIHKYFNDGIHNHNDFGIAEIASSVNKLSQAIGFDPGTAMVHNLEFGVNITVPFMAKDFLQNQIVNFKGHPKTKNGPVNGKGYLVEFEKTAYLIKFYDKGVQYDLEGNILRFEIRTKKMEFIQSTGIRTLSDLADSEKIRRLIPILLKAFDVLLIYDLTEETKLSKEDWAIYLHGTNADRWNQIKPLRRLPNSDIFNSSYKRQQTSYYASIARFTKMLERNNLDETKKLLRNLIKNKCDQLLTEDILEGW